MASDTPDQNLSQYFSECNDFIHAARLRDGNVLIHCLAGMSRSVTVAVAYIMSVTQLSWKEALKVVRTGRSVANPNLGFQIQLQDFEMYKLAEVCNECDNFRIFFLSNCCCCFCIPTNYVTHIKMINEIFHLLFLFHLSTVIILYICAGTTTTEGTFSNACHGSVRYGSVFDSIDQLPAIVIEQRYLRRELCARSKLSNRCSK